MGKAPPFVMHAVDFRKLVSNFTLLSGGEVLGKLLAFATFTYLARTLGPRSFGYLEFTIALMVFFTLLTDFGTSPFGARETAKNKDHAPELAGGIIALRFVLAAFGYLLLILFSLLLPQRQLPAQTLILIYGVTLFYIPGLLQWIFQGLDLMKKVAVGSLLRQAIFAAGVFLFIRREEQFWQVGWIECAAVSGLVLYNVLGLRSRISHLRLSSRSIRNILPKAFPFGISDMSWALSWYLPAILLGWMAGPRLVGWYAVAFRPIMTLHTFVWLYFFNLLPSLSRASAGPQQSLQELLHRSMRFASWSAVFIGISGMILARPIILLIYGNEYLPSVPIFQILIWLIPIALLSGHYRYALIASNLQKYEMISSVVTATVCFIIGRIGILYFGALGAAFALLVASLVNWFLAYYFVQKKIGHVPFAGHIVKPVTVGAIMALLFLLLLPVNPWLAAAASLISFIVLFLTLQPEWRKLLVVSK